jgi:uncharacterized membrane protein (DUF485 family)
MTRGEVVRMAESGAAREPGAAPGPSVRGDGDVREAEVHELMKRRGRVGGVLTVIMLVVYFTFIVLWAVSQDFLADEITDGFSVGMLLGVIVILTTWAVTFVYARWANRSYEPEVRRLRR